jgi:hypothetical protein
MKRIRLTQGKTAIVDDCVYGSLKLHKWFAYFHHGNWYAARNIFDKGLKDSGKSGIIMIRMHRLILGFKTGDRRIGDHINGNTLDNRRCNLRECTVQQNNQNRKSKKKYKGVYKDGKRWYAKIHIKNGREQWLGTYATAKQAAIAYNAAASVRQGEFARLNQV